MQIMPGEGFEIKPVIEQLIQQKTIINKEKFSVFDVGCGYPNDLLDLEKTDLFSTLTGIDKLPAEELFYIGKPLNFLNGEPQISLPENIVIRTSLSINEYLQSNIYENEKFDFILISNFLHQFNSTQIIEILNALKNRLQFGGIIIIRSVNKSKIFDAVNKVLHPVYEQSNNWFKVFAGN